MLNRKDKLIKPSGQAKRPSAFFAKIVVVRRHITAVFAIYCMYAGKERSVQYENGCRLSDLANKDVIVLSDGRKLGLVRFGV